MIQQSICLFRFVIPLLPIFVLYAKAALAVGQPYHTVVLFCEIVVCIASFSIVRIAATQSWVKKQLLVPRLSLLSLPSIFTTALLFTLLARLL